MIEIIFGVIAICGTVIGATWKLSRDLTCAKGASQQALETANEAKKMVTNALKESADEHRHLEDKIDKILEKI